MTICKFVTVAASAATIVGVAGPASAATHPAKVHRLTYQLAHRMVDRNTVIVQAIDWPAANAAVIYPVGTGKADVEGAYERSPVYRFHRDLRVTFRIDAGSARTLYQVVVETREPGARRTLNFWMGG